MWVSSPNSYFEKIESFIRNSAESKLLIIAPFIRSDALTKLLQNIQHRLNVIIVTSWKIEDILYGSSDLDMYKFCKENNYTLYINPNIHLKVIDCDDKLCVFGSSNITNRGLALTDIYNYELMSEPTSMDLETVNYLYKILCESTIVTDKIFSWYQSQVLTLPKLETQKFPTLPSDLIESETDFLISSLPMSRLPATLFRAYQSHFCIDDVEERECAIHDATLYRLPENLSEDAFYSYLSQQFFEHPFIVSLLNFINESESGRYFGEVKEWIQKHCTNVPIPSRRELTGNIQVLYKWITSLSNQEYIVDTPSYSERILRDI